MNKIILSLLGSENIVIFANLINPKLKLLCLFQIILAAYVVVLCALLSGIDSSLLPQLGGAKV